MIDFTFDIILNYVLFPIMVVCSLVVVLMVSCLVLSFIDFCFIPSKEFKKKGIIIAVNGIYDKDTGFLSSGSVQRTSLLFKDGELITFGQDIEHIIINKQVILRYERTRILNSLYFKSLEY